ncbi:MAG: alpha-mannosidase [Candidatus Hydrogenedentota bacterium]
MPHVEAERRIERAQLERRLNEVYGTLYSNRQPIADIQYCVTGKGKGPERMPKTGWKPFKVLQMWGGFDQTTWFKLRLTIPKSFSGKRVVALVRAAESSFIPTATGLTEGGESLAYINGVPFQGLDRNRDELVLVEKAKGGEKFEIVLEACPSTRFDLHHIFAYADIAVMNPLVWEFYWDVKTALEVSDELDVNYAPQRKLVKLLHDAVWAVDLQHKGETSYFHSIAKAQKHLRSGLKEFANSYGMGKLVLAGHAHIDTAWLWPLRETQRKCSRTFSTILKLMDMYPEFHFSCSQPIQYEWIKTYWPELYTRIKQRVKEGRWELCGAPWVEPDHNVPAGESLIRQYLYGNRFFEKEFGRRSHIAWVPDSFGYTWSLPQIMKGCGLTAFITTKIDWSQFAPFPYSMFEWEGIDGTRITAVMPPLNYNGNPVPKDCIAQWNLFKQKELVDELPFSFGWGDGGGGPTMAMIERGRRLNNIVGVPKMEFGRLEDTVDRMQVQAEGKSIPVYNGELYLELHRGCQTTQARTKRNNRKCEFLLRDAEFLSSLALLAGGKYDNETLIKAWKIVLTNQFHDILPGSSLTEVYTTADKDYAEAKQLATSVRDNAAAHLVKRIDTSGPGTPIVVFNSLSWVRNDIATAAVAIPKGTFHVVSPHGDAVPHQVAADGSLLFQADGVPTLGHAVYRVMSGAAEDAAASAGLLKASKNGMENEFVRLTFDAKGRIKTLYDKLFEREVLAPGQTGNVLQLFDDRPYDHDAWDIDHNFEEIAWEPDAPESIKVIETGPVRAVVRFVRKTEKSVIRQDVIMYANSPRIDFDTKVEWNEKRTLLKVAFPVDVRSSSAAFEIQYGTIERPTHRNDARDRGRFEVPAIKWADLSESNYGVSLLNDCKYGYDVKDNVLRLSLLRSSIDPDPRADEGHHEFIYSLYPHGGDWRTGTVQTGYELNVPLFCVVAKPAKGAEPEAAAFASVDAENVCIDWVKRHEDSNAIVVRLYEAYGWRGDVTVTFDRKPKRIVECNLVEEKDKPVKITGNSIAYYTTPYQVKTFKVTF